MRLLLLSCFTLIFFFAQAQEKQPYKPKGLREKESPNKHKSIFQKFDKEKLFVGGNLGLNFGSVTYINLSPTVGYRFTEKFSSGLGFIYNYINFKSQGYSTNIYGGKVFARYFVFPQVFAEAEYEIINYPTLLYNSKTTLFEPVRVSVPGFLIGGGVSQKLGNKSIFYVMILYNMLQSDLTPYSNPRVSGGFNIGF